MSGAVTPWAAGISEQVEQRRREIEAFRPQPRAGDTQRLAARRRLFRGRVVMGRRP